MQARGPRHEVDVCFEKNARRRPTKRNFTALGTPRQVNCLKITPDKQFLAAAGNPHVRLFEINSQNSSALVSYNGHSSNVTDVGEMSYAARWVLNCRDTKGTGCPPAWWIPFWGLHGVYQYHICPYIHLGHEDG